MRSVETSQSTKKSDLIEFSLSPQQDSKLDLQEKGEEYKSVLSVSHSNKSSPPLQPRENDSSSDLEQSIEAPPTTSQHTSLDGSHSTVEEEDPGEEDGERENGDKNENNVSGQIAKEQPPSTTCKSTPGRSPTTSDGSTTPELSPLSLSLQPASGELGSLHAHADTPSTATNSSHTQDTTPSLKSSASVVASSSRTVAFSVEEGVSPSVSMSAQLGLLLSPGSLQQQAGLSFQTPPSSSSYQLMSELPPTPFQEANFDLDSSSSSDSEHKGEKDDHRQLSHHESGNSFDSSYFRRLQTRVMPLISQDDIETPSLNHELDDVISTTNIEEEPQPKLVDIDESPSISLLPTNLQPATRSHRHDGVLDSANSLKVDDLLGLDSPGTSSQVLQQSPLLKAYQSPQVGLLVDIRTPGSGGLSGKPLLTSTVQGQQVSATAAHEQRGHVPSPTSDILLPYLPSHSGTTSGASVTSGSVDSQHTWSSLMNTGNEIK